MGACSFFLQELARVAEGSLNSKRKELEVTEEENGQLHLLNTKVSTVNILLLLLLLLVIRSYMCLGRAVLGVLAGVLYKHGIPLSWGTPRDKTSNGWILLEASNLGVRLLHARLHLCLTLYNMQHWDVFRVVSSWCLSGRCKTLP